MSKLLAIKQRHPAIPRGRSPGWGPAVSVDQFDLSIWGDSTPEGRFDSDWPLKGPGGDWQGGNPTQTKKM